MDHELGYDAVKGETVVETLARESDEVTKPVRLDGAAEQEVLDAKRHPDYWKRRLDPP